MKQIAYVNPAHLLPDWLKSIAIWKNIYRQEKLASKIVEGIRRGEFRVEYQPVCSTLTGLCSGIEALLRWTLPGGRDISPEEFIPVAENGGIIDSLTRHLFMLITRDVLGGALPSGFRLSINVSPLHLQDPRFAEDISRLQATLEDYRIRIMLEITERSLMKPLPPGLLLTLRKTGITIALDDFGTGYNTLSLLQEITIDCIKIERRFTESISEGDTRVLESILHLARKMNLEVIAEGVSQQKQLNWLSQHEVPYVQGFLCARPMTPGLFRTWIALKNSSPERE